MAEIEVVIHKKQTKEIKFPYISHYISLFATLILLFWIYTIGVVVRAVNCYCWVQSACFDAHSLCALHDILSSSALLYVTLTLWIQLFHSCQ